MTLNIPLIYVKDKQAFSKDRDTGALRLIGNPVEAVKGLKKSGTALVHIVDLDAINGNPANMDIYDKLTYFVHIQVEGPKDEKMVKRLLGINARVVIPLPLPPKSKINLKKFAEKRRLLVGKIKNAENAGNAMDEVFDLIYSGNDEKELSGILKTKRRTILASGELESKIKGKSKLFGIIPDY